MSKSVPLKHSSVHVTHTESVHSFSVMGRHFPMDMLRYDQCWPDHSDDVEAIMCANAKEGRTVTLRSHRPPTRERWESFGWKVTQHNVV